MSKAKNGNKLQQQQSDVLFRELRWFMDLYESIGTYSARSLHEYVDRVNRHFKQIDASGWEEVAHIYTKSRLYSIVRGLPHSLQRKFNKKLTKAMMEAEMSGDANLDCEIITRNAVRAFFQEESNIMKLMWGNEFSGPRLPGECRNLSDSRIFNSVVEDEFEFELAEEMGRMEFEEGMRRKEVEVKGEPRIKSTLIGAFARESGRDRIRIAKDPRTGRVMEDEGGPEVVSVRKSTKVKPDGLLDVKLAPQAEIRFNSEMFNI